MTTLLFALSPLWAAGTFQDTIHVPVTIWDYHPDGSNPEFEKTPTGTPVHLGMVDSTLDAEKKPKLGPVPYWSCSIAKWFRPWVAGDFTIPNYTNPSTATCGNPVSTVDYDTAFKNIRIDTFLVFTYVPGSQGSYEFVNASFFPIDGRGFGNEVAAGQARTHNYSFAIELHWTFTKAANMAFSFTGDDDVWAFLNNKLAMDIGGIHNPTSGTVTVDDIPGLVNGQKYSFDFFYAERHVTGSSIRITSNIIAAPSRISINAIPSDTIRAGDTATLIGTIYDIDGTPLVLQSDSIRWTQVTAPAPAAGDRITGAMNDTTQFTATVAYRTVGIIATFRNSTTTIIDTVWITVIPNVAEQVDIVAQSKTALTPQQVLDSAALNTVAPRLTVTLDSVPGTSYVYAVLRDRYGNLVGLATNVTWVSLNTDTATVAPTLGKPYEGLITRAPGALTGMTSIVVSDPALTKPDTALVTLSEIIPLALLDTAITRDANGNGFIDHIDLTFNRPATIATNLTGSFTVRFGSTTFTVTAISLVPGDGRHYQLTVEEPTAAAMQISPLQTAWTPTVEIALIPNVAVARTVTALDGCAPVIARIIKKINSANDRTKDTVKVWFSEKIYNQTGGTFPLTNIPVETFIAWWGFTGTALADSLISGITVFVKNSGDTLLVFSMSNSKNLTSENWINIRASSALIRDARGNLPADNNRRVQVQIQTILVINAFPNPSGVTVKRIPNDSIVIENVVPGGRSVVKDWVTADRAGTVISLGGIARPDTARTRKPVTLTMKIYDAVGNSVTWTRTEDLFKSGSTPSEVNLYWNGINKRGMKVAPGIYRASVYVNYPPAAKIQDIKSVKIIGIRP
jgi:fibro-slime domain-containing protein